MKKFFSIVVASAVVAAALAGCGGAGSDSTADNTAADNTAADNTAAADNTEGGEGAADGASFKIGGIGPVTGAAAVYGQAVKNAAQLAVDEINAAGGVNGATIEFNFQDDEHDAEKAVNAYNTLKDWNMQKIGRAHV